jgi:hypothetical protein
MGKSSTREDREWRCMEIAIYLYRYIEHMYRRMQDSQEPITLTALADYLETNLESDCLEEFVAWEFAIGRSPEVLRRIADDLGANGFDKALSRGEYVPVVLMMANDVLHLEDLEPEEEQSIY